MLGFFVAHVTKLAQRPFPKSATISFMKHNVQLLLVDDEAAITDNLAPFLQRAGFGVVVASDGEEALRQVTAVPTCLALRWLRHRVRRRGLTLICSSLLISPQK